jgi:hypothetical protein
VSLPADSEKRSNLDRLTDNNHKIQDALNHTPSAFTVVLLFDYVVVCPMNDDAARLRRLDRTALSPTSQKEAGQTWHTTSTSRLIEALTCASLDEEAGV